MKHVALLGLLMISAQASAVEIRCDGCSESAYQTKAASAGVGTHYVYDLVKGYARKYAVERSCEEGMLCYIETTALPVEDDVVRVVMELTAYRQATGGSMKSYFTFIATDPVQNLSAFDVAGPGGPRTQLTGWLHDWKSLSIRNALPMEGAILHNMAVTAINIFKNNVGTTLVTVEFSDGSSVDLEFESINGTFTVVEGSAVDAYGNVIPTSLDQINNLRFDYSREGLNGPAQQRMRNYLSLYGVKVATGTRWSCVKVSDSAWHCSPY